MSLFSETTKSELARLLPEKECCRLSELAALTKAEASVQITSTGRSISFRTEVATVARKIYHLLRLNFGVKSEITIIRRNRLKKNNVYLVGTGTSVDLADIMQRLGVLGASDHSHEMLDRIKHKNCCARSFLRGTFLGCGSVMNPDKGYHLEFVMEDEDSTGELVEIAAQLGVRLRTSSRKGKDVCYLKGVGEIATLLTLMGAHSALLELESVRVVREMRNGVNRLVNCETANVDKVVSASLKQTDAIRYLVERVGYESLPDSLGELAKTRMEYPDVSLRELGELLHPKVGKSGVNHRMRRLMELAADAGFRLH